MISLSFFLYHSFFLSIDFFISQLILNQGQEKQKSNSVNRRNNQDIQFNQQE